MTVGKYFPKRAKSIWVHSLLSHTYKTQDQNSNPRTDEAATVDGSINLIKVSKDFAIVPNPSSSTIEIIMNDAKFNKVTISTIDGKTVIERNIEKTDRTLLDVSRYANGIYIINVTSEDGQLYTKKLIKN